MDEENILEESDFWSTIDNDEFDDSLLEDEDVIIQDEQDLFEDEDYSLFDNLDEDYVNLEMQGYGKYLPPKTNSDSRWDFTADLVGKESGGDYKAYNSAGGGEGAVGKYQFRWTTHSPKIKQYAASKGIKLNTKEEFMNSPTLQDGFYEDYWVPNEIMPAVNRLKRSYGNTLNDSQLAKLVHFRGEAGAGQYLRGELSDKPESYNSSISSYIGMQYGGLVESPIEIDYNYTQYNPQIIEEVDPSLMADVDLTGITEYIDSPVQQENLNFNRNNISNGVSLANSALDVVDTVKSSRNNLRRKIAQTTSDAISGINNIYAENRNKDNIQDMFKRLRERPYYGRTTELNNTPIYS